MVNQKGQEYLINLNKELKVPTKKSVIILTPPARALEDPCNLSEGDL